MMDLERASRVAALNDEIARAGAEIATAQDAAAAIERAAQKKLVAEKKLAAELASIDAKNEESRARAAALAAAEKARGEAQREIDVIETREKQAIEAFELALLEAEDKARALARVINTRPCEPYRRRAQAESVTGQRTKDPIVPVDFWRHVMRTSYARVQPVLGAKGNLLGALLDGSPWQADARGECLSRVDILPAKGAPREAI